MNRYFLAAAAASLALAVAVMGCQTAKPAVALVPAEKSAIQAESSGFSPRGDAAHAAMELSLLFGSRSSVRSWKVEISGDKGVAKVFSGDGDSLPPSLSWDGKTDAGALAAEGTYTARLSVDYRDTYEPAFLESKSFLLDLTPPSAKLVFAPPQLTPSQSGVESPVAILIDAYSALARIDSWSLDIQDPAGELFRSFSDKWPAKLIEWDGTSLKGDAVKPATTYTAVATVRDEYGNATEVRARLPVSDIPLASSPNIIQPRTDGFSPRSETSMQSMEILVAVGNPEAVKSWKIVLLQAEKGIQKTFSGDTGSLPHVVSWDGIADSGASAPEGTYYAAMSVDYGKAFKSVFVRSRKFILDATPPTGTVTANPPRLTPDGKGGIAPVTFTIVANSGLAAITDWTLSVKGPDGLALLASDGKWPARSVSWDGRIAGGSFADPTKPYTVSARVRDQFGNTGVITGSLALGELPPVQGAVALTPGAKGFSPNGDSTRDTMEFAVSYGQPSAVKSWKIEMTREEEGVEKTFSGDGSSLPASIVWDGKRVDGRPAPEGAYTARLTVDYGNVFQNATVTSAPFVLDVSPPAGSLSVTPALFSPTSAGDTVTIALNAGSLLAKIDSWTMDIFDPAGNLFRRFSGRWPDAAAAWDGKGSNGDMVESAEDYPVVARVKDEFGNVGEVRGKVPVDILVEKTASGFRIQSSRIFFKAFTADYTGIAPDLARQNVERLDRLAEKLKKFPGYRIKVVGHAVMINWDDPVLGKAEQEDILIPLSQARAEAVKKAMVDRGVDGSLIAAEGIGASDQLVPDSNYTDRWRNRRVAFFLEK